MIKDEYRKRAYDILKHWYEDAAALSLIKADPLTTPLERRTIEFSKGLLTQAASQLDTALRVGDQR